METRAAGDVESVVWSAITNVISTPNFSCCDWLIEENQIGWGRRKKREEDVLTKIDW